ncbi:MAG: protein translocase subunit SecD [Burkholderiales bacterium]
MNRYALWKYLLVLGTLVAGFLYTAPNFFGEAPAVQLSPLRSTIQLGTSQMQTVEQVLKSAGIEADGMTSDPQSIRVRLRDTDAQLKAKDLLNAAFNPDAANPSYIVALNLVSNSPRWLTRIGALPMYLGLDLRGGIHFLLQVDMKSAIAKKLDGQLGYIRTALRDAKISGAAIARDGDAIIVRLRDAAASEKAEAEIRKVSPELAVRASEQGGEFRITATLTPGAVITTQKAAVEQNITTLRNRVNELGVAEPIIQQQGADRIVVQLPGVQDTARAKDILGRTATLEFRMVEAQASDPNGRDYDPGKIEQARNGTPPFGTELHFSTDGRVKEALLLARQPIITGERLTNASPSFDQQDHKPIVNIELDGQGARQMKEASTGSVGRRMAVLLIEKGKPEVITAPVFQAELGGRFQISGRFTTKEANDLALLLRAGSLAAPMEIVEERTVGPSLGKENIAVGFHSTWIGFAAISLFMIAYYALFGVFSVVALAANLLFLIALLSLLQATLTLPGMAGIALTIGMAIDANVLINERIREELRNGVTPQAAITAGFDRAWGTILDSNATTLIAGLALFAFGSGPVKGFAVVLCLGILTSMFSAVTVARAQANLWYGSRRKLTSISIGQIWRPTGAAR